MRDKLVNHLASYGGAAIAFNGDVDSILVAACLVEAVGSDKALAITVVTDMHPVRERKLAADMAAAVGIRQVECPVDVFAYPDIISNGSKRCYYCKKTLFTAMKNTARQEGFDVFLDGTDLDDTAGNRAGLKAIREAGVQSPLADMKFSKEDVREVSQLMGLPGSLRNPLACLATRLPAGKPITRGKMVQIDRAEDAIEAMGFVNVRVRHHGDLARIELRHAEEIARAATPDVAAEIAKQLREKCRFNFVTLDMEGYRRSSVLALPKEVE